MIFYTNSTKHLVNKIKTGRFVLKRFSDGEIYARIEEKVKNKSVWVIASTFAPADNLIELVFLLDALKRCGAKINLLVPYFGYSRQDRIVEGECFSSKLICGWFKDFNLKRIITINIHGERLKKFLKYKDIIPFELYARIAKNFDVLVAPDKGAKANVQKLSSLCEKPLVVIEKFRPKKEQVKILELKGNVKNKRALIVDDMISTGGTIIEASKVLLQKGAKEVSVIATHGVFSGDAIKNLEKSKIKNIYVTNSIQQKKSRKLKVIDLSGFLKKLI